VRGFRVFLIAFIGAWLGLILNASLAPRIAVVGIQPDFCLVLTGLLSVTATRILTTSTSFACAVGMGVLAGVNMFQLVITRVLAAFLGSSVSASLSAEPSPFSVAVFTAGQTIFCQTVYFFIAPSGGFGRFLGDTIGGAAFNGLLVLPLFALLRKILVPARF
jgi:hypothetical protein